MFRFCCVALLVVAAVLAKDDSIPPYWDELVKKLDFTPGPFQPHSKIGAHCATDSIWEWKYEFFQKKNKTLPNAEAACPFMSECDVAENRNSYQGPGDKLVIDMIVNVLCYSEGNCAGGVDDLRVMGQLATVENNFHDIGIQFRVNGIYYHVNPEYASIRKYSILPFWLNDIKAVKNLYAVDPEHNINIFVTDQEQGNQGTLLGIGTFPWDTEYLTSQGGLWMNARFFGPGEKTLAHEFGHNLGLWHVFHGVNEESSCGSACHETPHPANDPSADETGDFCSDTLSAPRNYYCAEPAGQEDCSGISWTTYGTDLTNFMAYTPDDCMASFTPNQQGRARCYLCEVVPTILDSSTPASEQCTYKGA